jgi:copper(I)-binding protein
VAETLVWIGLLAFVVHRFWPQLAAVVGAGQPGEVAPDIRFTTLDGESRQLSDYRGQVVLVNFWATWCPPCRVEMPGFQKAHEELGPEGFTLLGLSVDVGGHDGVRQFLAERGITYPVAVVGEAQKQAFGGTPLLPTSILIDREGRIRHRVEGFFAPPALRVAVRRLLADEGGQVVAEDLVADPEADPSSAIQATEGWIRPPAPTGDRVMTGGFATLLNLGAETDTLVGVQARNSDLDLSIELHETVLDGDVARMRRAGPVPLPAGEVLELRPGGHHLMIGGPAEALVAGTRVEVVFRFARAGDVVVALAVGDPG